MKTKEIFKKYDLSTWRRQARGFGEKVRQRLHFLFFIRTGNALFTSTVNSQRLRKPRQCSCIVSGHSCSAAWISLNLFSLLLSIQGQVKPLRLNLVESHSDPSPSDTEVWNLKLFTCYFLTYYLLLGSQMSCLLLSEVLPVRYFQRVSYVSQ